VKEKHADGRDNINSNAEKLEGDALTFPLVSVSLEKYEFMLKISTLMYLD